MTGLPADAVGEAVGVLIYTFISLLTNLTLIWLLWVHRERFSYIALIAYFVELSIVISIIQQIYQYTHFSDNMWRRYHYIMANYPNADVIYKDGNSGITLVFSNIRYYCYSIECTYLFTYTLHIATSIFGVWTIRRRAERIYVILSKIVPIIITTITIGVEYTPVLQSNWITYLIVANIQTVASCIFSIVLIAMILWKYIDTKKIWNSVTTLDGSSVSWGSCVLSKWRCSSRNVSSTSEHTPWERDHVPKSLLDNNWLVVRLLVAIVFISGFALAFILVHLPVPAEMAREIMADAPELTAAKARAGIVGHVYGVLPGLAVPIVFGLTKPFRHTLYETFRVKRWWTKKQHHRGQRVRPARHRPDSQSITPWPQLRDLPQDSEFQARRDLGSHPTALGQDWITRMDTNLARDLYEQGSYEMSGGMNQHDRDDTRLGSLIH
ncbi:hypothetical protein F4860DRAFT_481578 [Xylaria cubensis]|nr:hypothetical protein F4860DRAFT_481578 [Xylaria cubensis]